MAEMQSAGSSTGHGVVEKTTKPSLISKPQVEVGGRTPMPRKDNVASVSIAPGIAKASETITGARTFGKRCFSMIRVGGTPMQRAVHQAREDVAAQLIGAEEERRIRVLAPEGLRPDRLQELVLDASVEAVRVVRREHRSEDRHEGEERDHHHADDRRAVAEQPVQSIAPERALLTCDDGELRGAALLGRDRGRHQATLIRGSSTP